MGISESISDQIVEDKNIEKKTYKNNQDKNQRSVPSQEYQKISVWTGLMDDLDLNSMFGQSSWQHNLFCTILYTLLLLIWLYFLAKLNYYLLFEGIKAWKQVFQDIKEFYYFLTMQNIKTVVSCLGSIIYCFFMMFFYTLIAPFHALYLFCRGFYPGNRPRPGLGL